MCVRVCRWRVLPRPRDLSALFFPSFRILGSFFSYPLLGEGRFHPTGGERARARIFQMSRPNENPTVCFHSGASESDDDDFSNGRSFKFESVFGVQGKFNPNKRPIEQIETSPLRKVASKSFSVFAGSAQLNLNRDRATALFIDATSKREKLRIKRNPRSIDVRSKYSATRDIPTSASDKSVLRQHSCAYGMGSINQMRVCTLMYTRSTSKNSQDVSKAYAKIQDSRVPIQIT